jgi:checkpoint serine/threonine-protein kinase
MTLHTRAATDDIYDIFNAPLKPTSLAGDETGDDDDDEEDDNDDDVEEEDEDEDEDMTDAYYGSDGESTGTTKQTHQGEQEDDEAADAINIRE